MFPFQGEGGPLRHHLSFRAEHRYRVLHEERIEDAVSDSQSVPYLAYHEGRKFLWGSEIPLSGKPKIPHDLDQSLLREFRGYDGVSRVARYYETFRIYRDWTLGRASSLRQPQRTDELKWPLKEDFSNLGLFLDRLAGKRAKEAVVEGLRDLYPEFSDYHLSVEAGTVQVEFFEGSFTIPAPRLSDGSLRYLCLLAMLLDPAPPSLIVIEEPEVVLHADLLHKIADLLVAASERTQLIVTTHSEIIVDALTDHAESIIVCEKEQGCTTMKRLSQKELEPWLEKYRLGALWTMGDLGGTRW